MMSVSNITTISNMSPTESHSVMSSPGTNHVHNSTISATMNGGHSARGIDRDLGRMTLEEKFAELDRLVQLEKGVADEQDFQDMLSYLQETNSRHRQVIEESFTAEGENDVEEKKRNKERMQMTGPPLQPAAEPSSKENNDTMTMSELDGTRNVTDSRALQSPRLELSSPALHDKQESRASALNASLLKSYTTPKEFKFELEKRNPEDRKVDTTLQIQQKWMEECTFQPQISELPPSYSRKKLNQGSKLSFYERSVQWKEQLRREADQKALEKQLEEEMSCTFQPNASPGTMRDPLSGSLERFDKSLEGSSDTWERRTPSLRRSGSYSSEGSDIHERLYTGAFIRKLRKEEERQQIIEERLREECPFEPRKVAKNDIPVQSRYMRPEYWKKYDRREREQKEAEAQLDKECTFQPKINPKSKRSVGTSQLYLSTDPFERLSRPKVTPSKKSPVRPESQHGRRIQPNEGAEDSFLDTLNTDLFGKEHQQQHDGKGDDERGAKILRPSSAASHSSESRPRSAGAAAIRRPQSAQSNRSGRGSRRGSLTTDELSPSFQTFLERQQAREKKKQERITFIKNSTAPPHNPRINRRSEKIVRGKNGSFFDRLKVEVERRTKKKELSPSELEAKKFSFEPKINKTSKKMPRRSVEEMSIGDWQRRQRKIERARQKKEEEELAGFKFKPRTNRNPRARSFLGVSTDPDSYMERVKEMAEKQEERARMIKMQREQEELDKCTFRPRTHNAPEYVKRIAQSMAKLRRAESRLEQSTTDERPDWR